MPRYADIDKLLETFDADAPMNWNNTEAEIQEQRDFEYYRGLVENAPTADVAEVKHGEWVAGDAIDDGWIRYRCSECDYNTDAYYKEKYDLHRYCPKCGAKMDGGKNEQI